MYIKSRFEEEFGHILMEIKKKFEIKYCQHHITIKRYDTNENKDYATVSYPYSPSSIKKTMHYFIVNQEKIHSINIDELNSELLIKFDYSRTKKDYIKKMNKRTKNLFDMETLKQALHHFDHGVFIYNGPIDCSIIVRNRKNVFIEGFGIDFDKKKATQKAVFEYLERHAATTNLENQIYGSYNQLKNNVDVINPELLGIYGNEVHKQNSWLVAYDDNLEIAWCQAQSMKTSGNVYVPLQNVQYLNRDIKNLYVLDNSNGSAIGNSYEEAALFSLYEIIERSTFLTFWFGNTKAYRLKFNSDAKQIIGRQLYFHHKGFQLEFYLLENPMDIPVVWALLKATGASSERRIYSITGLGCNMDIKEAVDSAFFEVYNGYLNTIEFENQEIKKNEKMLNEEYLGSLEDHIVYFLNDKSKARLEAKEKRIIEDITYTDLKKNQYNYNNITMEFYEVTNRMKKQNDDIYLIDQTNEFLKSLSLHCVRTVIPNAVLLDFSSLYLRTNDNEINSIKIAEKNIHPLG